jgi:hypothetical protein
MSNLRAEYQATNLAIVSIRWRLFDRQDQPLWEWWNTYNLIDHGAGWKIAVSTTHAEMPSADPC